MRVGDGKGADGWKEIEVVKGGGEHGGRDGVTEAELRREHEDEKQQRERDRGGVDVEPAVKDKYNSGQSA